MKVKQPERKIRYDWSAFKENTNLHQIYSVTVRNRYSLLSQDDDDSNNYDHLVTAIAEENITMVPKVKKRNNWIFLMISESAKLGMILC